MKYATSEAKAKDVMTADMVRLSPDDSVQDAARTLAEHGVSGAPVVDAGGRILGVLTLHDMVRRGESEHGGDHGSPTLVDLEHARCDRAAPGDDRVEKWMTPHAVTVGAETTLKQVCRLMARAPIQRVYVVDQGRLVGVISAADIAPFLVGSSS